MADVKIKKFPFFDLTIESIIDEFKIIQTSHWEHLKRIETQIIDTKEEHVRELLIKLGWTPPKDKNKSR